MLMLHFFSWHVFVSKLALFILIDLVFSIIFRLSLAAFLFWIADGAKLSFASVLLLFFLKFSGSKVKSTRVCPFYVIN